ncbi:MAG: hypothetical protein KC478_14200 [Bacteriovoracaceae bacterium]|nr:hypothetical protein [Bacteriovoracaceae bacterium]
MKFAVFFIMLATVSCTEQKNTEPKAQAPVQNSIIEQNNACICTKDFRPVCGSNGISYPNPCQAKCEGITEFTDGSCASN